jgi:hypothetical protein
VGRCFSDCSLQIASSKIHYFNYESSPFFYSSPNIQVIKPRLMRLVGHVARVGDRKGAYRVLVRNPEGKRPFERLRRR